MENVIFEFYIGDTYSRDFTLSGYTSPIDEVYFSVKKNNTDKRTVLQKTLEDGITLVDVEYDTDGSILKRTYNILIDASDTEDMQMGYDYSFDIEIVTPVLSGENIKKTVITGIFRLKEATTRSFNES